MSLHLDMCSLYRKAFVDVHGYEFCEVCGINGNGTMKFEVHHIYFASLYPRHPELHNFRNLIMVCLQCHSDFHGRKNDPVFRDLERQRGLKKLFA